MTNSQRNESHAMPGDRLESWKEIAAYFNRSERTVRRWEEKEALPVHRLQHDKRGSVYAYAQELEAWRESRKPLVDVPEPPETPQEAAPNVSPDTSPGSRAQWFGISLAVMLVASLGLLLLIGRQAPAAGRPRNPEAVRAYQRARFGDNAGRVQIQSGIRNYQEAIRLDPSFAAAWAGLATAHVALTWFGEVAAGETMAQAKSEAAQALRLDPSDGVAWSAMGWASHYLDWDHAASEKHFRRGIELAPENAVAQAWFAETLIDLRRFDEALTFAKRAQDTSPRWLGAIVVSGNVHYFAGRPDLAMVEYRRALEIEPNHGLANHFLGRAYLAKGNVAAAVDQLRKSHQLMGEVPFSGGDFGYALAVAGRRDDARKMLAEFAARRQRGYFPAFVIAQIHAGLGETSNALDWLERAADERNIGYYMPSVDPVYDSLRSHPRFRSLLQRLHLGS